MISKKPIRTLSILAMIAALWPSASSAAEPVDYDRLVVQGAQLLSDGSWEESKPEESEWWSVVRDGAGAKHGVQYTIVSPKKGVRYMRRGIEGTPHGRMRLSFWARGKGTIRPEIKVFRQNWRTVQHKDLLQLASEEATVDSDEWRLIVREFDVPESVLFEGEAEKPGKMHVQVAVRGEVAFDQCLLALADRVAASKSAAAPGAATAVAVGGAPPAPVLTLVRMNEAPVVDGKFGPGEWTGATAVTGFTEARQMTLAARQTTVYAGYDDNNLYFAFRCPHRGRLGKGKPARDKGWNAQTEAVEVWVQPPGETWYHMLGWPAGGIVDEKGVGTAQERAWNADWQFANDVEDAGEAVGGILTFERVIWTAEIAIAFDELGVEPPAPGDAWRMNFCRAFSVEEGSRRTASRDWTTWAPMPDNFRDPERFGHARFAAGPPAVQFTEVGDLANGQLAVTGVVAGGEAIVSARALAEDGKTLSLQSEHLESPGKDGQAFRLEDTLKVAGARALRYEVRAEKPGEAAPLVHAVIPFRATTPLRMTLAPFPSKETLYVSLDASRVAELPERPVVEVRLFRGSAPTDVVVTDQWTGKWAKGDLEIPTKGLEPGAYEVKAFLKADKDGPVLASSVSTYEAPGRLEPEWLGNRIGVSDEAPAPWSAVEVDGSVVRVTDREYLLEDSGLPARVTALGESLLVEPARIRAVVGGVEQEWDFEPIRKTRQVGERAEWDIAGRAGPLRLEGTLKVEFDGFARWTVTVEPDEAVSIDSLAIEFPFAPERARYARGPRGRHNAALDNGYAPREEVVANIPYSVKGWAWPDEWMPQMWVGDDERGLAFMNPSEQYLRGKRRNDVEQRDDRNILRIYLVDGPAEVGGPLRYDCAWQATPVRPAGDPKNLHWSYGEIDKPGYYDRVFATFGSERWSLKYLCYPVLKRGDAKDLGRRIGKMKEHGVHVTPYWGTNQATYEAPELQPFLKEWESHPPRSMGPRAGCGGRIFACLESDSYADYTVWAIRKTIDDLGFGGVYLDSSSYLCSNRHHGCGWWDEETGEWRRTYNMFAWRDVYKRLYRMMKAEGRDAVMVDHGIPVVCVAGFYDLNCQGESWCAEGPRQYDRLTPEFFRISEMRTQYGVPYLWYVFHHRWRGKRFGGSVPLTDILAYGLPHRCLAFDGREGWWPVWDVTDQFWTDSEFLPYWRDDCPAETGEERVLATVYRQKEKGRAWLVVANWNTEPRDVVVRIDREKLGLGDDLSVVRALEHPFRHPDEPEDIDPMTNQPLKYKDGRLPLSLAARNLELLRIERR